jgi:UDP-glucose:glycoprotein glucosyltransferase
LFALADKPSPSIEYIFRHLPETTDPDSRNFLSGYGVSLDLKKMDYLAVDDRNTGPGEASAQEDTAGTELPPIDPIMSLIEAYPEPEITSADSVLSEEAISGSCHCVF